MIQLTFDDYLFRQHTILQQVGFVYRVEDLMLKQLRQREQVDKQVKQSKHYADSINNRTLTHSR